MEPRSRTASSTSAIALLGLALAFSGCQGPGGSSGSGGWYELGPGETIYSVARRHGVSVSELIEANQISDVRSLPVGARLWIPASRPPEEPMITQDPGGRPRTPAPPPSSSYRRARALEFAWPLRGRVTTSYGPEARRPHDGIDLAAPRGTLVRAAEAGRVTWSGELGDYGLAVVVRHDDEFTSVYAHHRNNRVPHGAFVDKGDVVGEVGTTGNATGPHLHFEIRRGSEPVDPLALLP